MFDPRTGQPTQTLVPSSGPASSSYPRGMNLNAAAAAVAAVAAAGGRSNRSLWTPNGNVINGPTSMEGNKNSTAKWSGSSRRGSNNNNGNRGSDASKGGGEGR